MSVVAIVTYTNELTVNLCIDALKSQTVPIDDIYVLDNVYPMRKAFNTCLDYAFINGYDFVWIVAADVILDETALYVYKLHMKHDVFAVFVTTYDFILKEHNAAGTFFLDMRVIQDKYRFGTGLTADMDFINTVERNENMEKVKVRATPDIGVHHPIYTPFDLYAKLRFSLPKYTSRHVIDKYRNFFITGLSKYPDNQTLSINYPIFNAIEEDKERWKLKDKNPIDIKKNWDEYITNNNIELDNNSYYAMEEYNDIAKELVAKGHGDIRAQTIGDLQCTM